MKLEKASTTGYSRKRILDVGMVAEYLFDTGATIGIAIIANAIYDRLKALSKKPDKVYKQSDEKSIEIIDENSGTRIVIKNVHSSETKK